MLDVVESGLDRAVSTVCPVVDSKCYRVPVAFNFSCGSVR